MTPLSFDFQTCREMVGSQRCQKIEAMAKENADLGTFYPPHGDGSGSWWVQRQQEFERRVYLNAYNTRHQRNLRLAGQL